NTALKRSVSSNPAHADNSQEQAKQQDLERRVSQLQESIGKLVISNNDAGLSISNDAAGNAVVIDQKAGQQGQAARVIELYDDNGGKVTLPADSNAVDFTSEAATSTKPMKPAEVQPAGQAGAKHLKKGNLNRGELRGRNQSQVEALSNEQLKSSNDQQQVNPGLNQALQGMNRSYTFLNGPNPAGFVDQRQFGTGATFSAKNLPPGPARDLVRQNGHPKLGTIVGMEAPIDAVVTMGLPARLDQGGGFGGNPNAPQGGPGAPPVNQNANPEALAFVPSVWSSSGGLSLLIEIPTDGQKLSFSKVGGEPRLMLGVRPHQTLQLALGFVWAAVWSVILLVILVTLRRPQVTQGLCRRLPWFISGLGMLLYFMVPSHAMWGTWGLIAFIAGATWIAFQSKLPRHSL
ncbi:MAG: hypothetical protein JWM11_880, partial [Planctomycetaceae bacterium]|nr:hypothetical protein [Planctomycetaceae bacterium]